MSNRTRVKRKVVADNKRPAGNDITDEVEETNQDGYNSNQLRI